MNEFLFIDNEYEKYNYYLIMGDMPMDELEEKFKKIYTELMDEYWNDDTSKWEYWDFYDELNWRLNRNSIMLNEPEILYHNDCF